VEEDTHTGGGGVTGSPPVSLAYLLISFAKCMAMTLYWKILPRKDILKLGGR